MKKRRHLAGGSMSMFHISKIFMLLKSGESKNEISKRLGISRSAIRDYQVKADSKGLDYGFLSQCKEDELKEIFISKKRGRKSKSEELDLPQLSKELLKKGVTKLLLYQEYYSKVDAEEAISYSGFCTKLREYKKSNKLSMKQEYKAGQKCFVDFSGLRFPIYSKGGDVLYEAEIFVSTLGLSNYTYVEAISSQNLEDFICATVRSLSFYGGSPECLVPDNLKSAVTKAGIEPDINRTYQELANYYGLSILPARVRKPQDKAKVETAVKLIQQKILAPLRNQRFYSLSELNTKIKELLEIFNQTVMKSYGYSRQELFEQVEKRELRELPLSAYDFSLWKQLKVHPDYHISVEECFYSVPWEYRGKTVDVCIRENMVEIFTGSTMIAQHKRRKLKDMEDPKTKIKHRFSTYQEHMPPNHQFIQDWTKLKAISLGKSIGEESQIFIEKLFSSYEYEPQAVRSSMSLPSLAKKYGKKEFEIVSRTLNLKRIWSVKALKEELKRRHDQQIKQCSELEPICEHNNIRGNNYYH